MQESKLSPRASQIHRYDIETALHQSRYVVLIPSHCDVILRPQATFFLVVEVTRSIFESPNGNLIVLLDFRSSC